MSPRELIILVLGFAMVGVLLRGLFVAIQVRRGQIRLTIDKNLPNDFDLEEFELSELPSGGARVVNRNNSALEENVFLGSNEADELHLSENEPPIPVLLDVVELEDFDDKDSLDDHLGINEKHTEEFEGNFAHDVNSRIEAVSELGEPAIASSTVFEDKIFQSASPENLPFSDGNDWDSSVQAATNAGPSVSEDSFEKEGIDELAFDNQTYPQGASGAESEAAYGDSSDYPENEWYEDEGVAGDEDEIPEGFHEENFSDSCEYDNLAVRQDPLAEFESTDFDEFTKENAPPASLSEFAHSEEDEDNFEGSSEFSLGDSLSDFSMTAGDRIGYDGAPHEENSESDSFSSHAVKKLDSNARKSILGGGLSSFFSAFSTKSEAVEGPNQTEVAEVKEFEGSTEQTDLIEEIEGFIEQNCDMEDTENSIDEPSPRLEMPDSDNVEPLQPDNVTSIEKAVEVNGGKSNRENNVEKLKGTQRINDPVEVLVISVMSPLGSEFVGEDLIGALTTAGLVYGDMGIFHLYDGVDDSSSIICSAANALNPGTFDLERLSEFSTIGVSFFLSLPTNSNNLHAFDKMLNVAQQVSSDLGGVLKDDHRSDMTTQTIEHYRQRVRDFELNQLRVAGSRG